MFLADTAVPGLDVLSSSVIGLVLVLSLFGWIEFKPSVSRLVADKERAEAQRDALVQQFQDDVIPVLTEVQRELMKAKAEALLRGEKGS